MNAARYNGEMENIITARDLVKDYGTKRAVDGVTFHVRRGEFFGFLGPNGAGKTTVMRIVHCFLPPTSGEVCVFDMDVAKSPSEIKARLGVMPQDDNLDPDLNCIENLMVYARYFDIPPRQSRPLARRLLEFVELSDEANVSILKLSGGMRRRLLLARTLINDPDLIILDEPTTGMDPHGRRAVWQYLADLKERGKGMVLTTHYMEEAERLCDRVAIMEGGRIIAMDTPRSLMRAHGGDLEEVYLKLTGRKLHEA